MTAMAFLGFASSHGGGHHGHDTAGHEAHGMGGTAHAHSIAHSHPVRHGELHAHNPSTGWKSHLWSWLSPRVMFNFLVGFGATGLIVERLVGPVVALPIAIVGGLVFESFVVRPIFKSLFRFESQPAQTLESALMSEGRAVSGFDVTGNGLIAVELGGEVVQVLGTQLRDERASGVRIRAGDIVRIEEIDSTRNRCTVSRIGIGDGTR
jgi:translation initiation factor IF-1